MLSSLSYFSSTKTTFNDLTELLCLVYDYCCASDIETAQMSQDYAYAIYLCF